MPFSWAMHHLLKLQFPIANLNLTNKISNLKSSTNNNLSFSNSRYNNSNNLQIHNRQCNLKVLDFRVRRSSNNSHLCSKQKPLDKELLQPKICLLWDRAKCYRWVEHHQTHTCNNSLWEVKDSLVKIRWTNKWYLLELKGKGLATKLMKTVSVLCGKF